MMFKRLMTNPANLHRFVTFEEEKESRELTIEESSKIMDGASNEICDVLEKIVRAMVKRTMDNKKGSAYEGHMIVVFPRRPRGRGLPYIGAAHGLIGMLHMFL